MTKYSITKKTDGTCFMVCQYFPGEIERKHSQNNQSEPKDEPGAS